MFTTFVHPTLIIFAFTLFTEKIKQTQTRHQSNASVKKTACQIQMSCTVPKKWIFKESDPKESSSKQRNA